MIRQAAFIEHNEMLKGALHCHTTRSDGAGAPGDVIRLHAENGYAFMAITDHRLYNYKNYAPETDMIIVPGMEIDRDFYGEDGRCFHTVAIGPAREDGNGFAQDERVESGKVVDQYGFQRALDELHAKNNMTIYCHPEWSNTPGRDFERLTGNFAMEIWNTGCAMVHDLDTNAAYWDELLLQNTRIFGVATDDGHDMSQHCRGWVMVNAAPELSAILSSLKAGAFYSSCGPVIRDFFVEDGKAVIECSPCAQIGFRYGRAPTHIVSDVNAILTRAEFSVPARFRYIRAIVKDACGNRAWSNPIFID